MKVLLVYFSATGNTAKVADAYGTELRALGHDVTSVALPSDAPPAFSDYDIIGVGYPIHSFNAPSNVVKFCKTFTKRDAKRDGIKRVFVFKTSGEPVRMSDVSSLKLRKILARRGYTVYNEYQYVMPYNIIFRHGDGAAYRMWSTAERLVCADTDEILAGGTRLPKKLFMGGMLAGVLRCEHWGAHVIGKTFKATDACVSCGMCISACPAGNITTNKKGKIKFGAKCMLCMRCVQNCPKAAIEMGMLNGWRVTGKYTFAEIGRAHV